MIYTEILGQPFTSLSDNTEVIIMLFLEMHSFTSCRLKGRRRKSVNVVRLQDENANRYCYE